MGTEVGTGGSNKHPDLFLSSQQCVWLGPGDVQWYLAAPRPLTWRKVRPVAGDREAALEMVSAITDFLISRRQKEMCTLFYELTFLSCQAGNTCIELGRHSREPLHLTLSLHFLGRSCRAQSNSADKKQLAFSTNLERGGPPPFLIPPAHVKVQGGQVPL